jgi:hypothetical protein
LAWSWNKRVLGINEERNGGTKNRGQIVEMEVFKEFMKPKRKLNDLQKN